MINKFGRIFRLEMIGKLLINVLGQLWQCLSSTYLLVGVGIVYCVLRLKKNIVLRQQLCIYAYPIAALFISVGMTAVAASGSLKTVGGKVRIDSLFYGRYNECCYSMLVMLGLVVLCTEEFRGVFKTYLGVIFVYLGMSVGMFFRMRGIENGYLNIVSSVSTHIFHWLGEFSVWKCSIIALLGGCVIVGMCQFKRLGKFGYYAGLFVLLFLFSTTALYCMRLTIRGENDNTARYTPMFSYLTENTQKQDVVYICQDGKMSYDLQTRLVDRVVVCTLPEWLSEVQDGTYVVVREEQLGDVEISEYTVCLENEEYVVIRAGMGG